MLNQNLQKQIEDLKQDFETYLKQNFTALPHYTKRLEDAMRYSLFSKSKRVRPLLVFLASQIGQPSIPEAAYVFASAIEYIHTYSLIHDDLPCMDNDTLRRNQPTNHIQFDEATALLAGDALLTQAFAIASQQVTTLDAKRQLQATNALANKAGIQGMVSGQAADMQVMEQDNMTQEEYLLFIHTYKTAKLFSVSTQIGAIVGGLTDLQQEQLAEFGLQLGICFQIQDDILETTSSTQVLGKNTTSDQVNDKLTYVSLYSVEQAQEKMKQAYEKARNILDTIEGKTELLIYLTESLLGRKA